MVTSHSGATWHGTMSTTGTYYRYLESFESCVVLLASGKVPVLSVGYRYFPFWPSISGTHPDNSNPK